MNNLSALFILALFGSLLWLAHLHENTPMKAHICRLENNRLVLIDSYEKAAFIRNRLDLKCEEKEMSRLDFRTTRKAIGYER